MQKDPVINNREGDRLRASPYSVSRSVESEALASDMQDTADGLEEADGRLQVKLMVYGALLRGVLGAVEVDDKKPLASEGKDSSRLNAKTDDITEELLTGMLHEEGQELIKLVDERDRKEPHQVLEKLKKGLTNGDARLLTAAADRRSQKMSLQDAYFLVQALSLCVQTLKKEASLVSANPPDVAVDEQRAWKCDLESRHTIEELDNALHRVAKEIRFLGGCAAKEHSNGPSVQPGLSGLQPSKVAGLERKSGGSGDVLNSADSTVMNDSIAGENMQTLIRANSAISHLKQKLGQANPKSGQDHLQEFSEQIVAVPGQVEDEAVLGNTWGAPLAEHENSGKTRFELGVAPERDALQGLEDNVWKIQVENAIITTVVSGMSRTCKQSLTTLSHEAQLERAKAERLRATVSELEQRLASSPPNASDAKTCLDGGQEPVQDSADGSGKARSKLQRSVESNMETANLIRTLKADLLARITSEKEKAGRLEETLVDQGWKTGVELDILATLFRPLDQRAVVPYGAPDSTKPTSNDLPETTRGEGESGGRADERLVDGIAQSDLGPIKLLERQNAELRRENEKLVEKQTDEIYKLKREFYKELEKAQKELRQANPELMSQRSATEASMAQRALSDLKMIWTKRLQDEVSQDLKSGGGRARDEASLSRVSSSKFEKNVAGAEQSGDLSSCLTSVLDREADGGLQDAGSKSTPAASESEGSVNNVEHSSEESKSLADERILNDVVVNQSSESKDEGNGQVGGPEPDSCASLGREASVSELEETKLGSECSVNLEEKIKTEESLPERCDDNLDQELRKPDLRDGGTQTHDPQYEDVCTPTAGSADYLSSAQDLKKAEIEVDMLGDEVDSLMDLLEKVYYVLNHYAPILQCYPGIADLLTLVRQEVLHRVQESDDVLNLGVC